MEAHSCLIDPSVLIEVRVRFHAKLWIPAALLALISTAALTQGSPPQQSDPNAITVTVTVTGHGNTTPPPIPARDVVVRQSGKVRPVISWESAQSSAHGLDLVILIDDALPNNVATRWDEFENFLTSLPANAHEGVAYANRGTIQFAQQPTLNHAQAAKALRNPAGVEIQNSAIYGSVQTLAHAWPANKNRRVILLLSSGIDYNSGAGPVRPDDLIPLQNAISEAQAKGIVVYAIYARPYIPSNLNRYLPDVGQSALISLSDETGGKAFIFGDQNPPSFKPFLDEFLQALSQQYTLTFQSQPESKPGFAPLHVAVEANSVQVRSPARVYVSGTK